MTRVAWVVALVLVGGSSAWALTPAQRETARSVSNQIQGKCEEIRRWADFVDRTEKSDWKHETTPITGETLTKTYDAPAQDKLQARYTTLKTELKDLVATLP